MESSVPQNHKMTKQHEFRDATRVQQSLLAGVEKKVLIRMAQRMPGWVSADHLTALGFASMIAAGFSYAAAGGLATAITSTTSSTR